MKYLVGLIILLALAGSASAQEYTGKYGTKVVLAGNQTDITNIFTIKAPTLGAPLTWTLPNANGTSGWVLQTDGAGGLSWVSQSAGFANPMTTTGDIITSNPGSTATRLGIGTANQVLGVSGGLPAWQTLGVGASLLGDGRATPFAINLANANTWTALITALQAGIAATYTDAVVVANTTASTSVIPVQQSPNITLQSHVWNTTATAADNTFNGRITFVPASGLTPTGKFSFATANNGGAYGEKFSINDGGFVNVPTGGSYQINGTSVINGGALGAGVTASSLTSVGTISTGTWNGTAVTVPYGGTGVATLTSNGIPYGNGAGAVQVTAASAGAGAFLQTTSSGGVPSFKTVLAEANGGTNQSTYTTGDIISATATNTLGKIGVGAANTVLTGGTTPTYATLAVGTSLLGNGVGTAFSVNMANANTWTGTQTFGAHGYTSSAPTTLAADQADWGLSTSATYFRIGASVAVNVTGIAGGTDGRAIYIVNGSAFAITLKDESVASIAANRIHGVGDHILAVDGTIILLYDGTSSRWRVIGGNN